MPRLRILVADDDVFLTELLRHKLQAAGHAVEIASDGLMALDRARAGLFDVVILDGLMPKMDGFEVLRRLNAEPPDPAPAVVMLTALKGESDIVGALRLGAEDYLAKPFMPEELLARIERIRRAPLSQTQSERHGRLG